MTEARTAGFSSWRGLDDSPFRFQSASRRQAPEDIVTDLTRRKMLGVAAATATGAVTSLSTAVEAATPGAPAAPAPSPLPDPADLNLFVALSSALTGIAAAKLAPTVDPIQVKNEYFAAASADPTFPALLQIIRERSEQSGRGGEQGDEQSEAQISRTEHYSRLVSRRLVRPEDTGELQRAGGSGCFRCRP